MMKTNLISCDKELDTSKNCKKAFVKLEIKLPRAASEISCVYNEKNESIHFIGGCASPKGHVSVKMQKLLSIKDYEEWKVRKRLEDVNLTEYILYFWIRKSGIGTHRVEKSLIKFIVLMSGEVTLDL